MVKRSKFDASLRVGLLLEYLTLAWNVVGAIIVLIAAYLAHSVALAGFGIDSLIEIFASMIVIWHLKGINERKEKTALRLIGTAFFALALYILVQAAYVLWTRQHPSESGIGIVWLAITFVAMLLLAWGKQRVGKRISNKVLMTEARVTLIDAYLAGAVLLGLLLNALLGWWWADPLAGLVIVYYGVKEGFAAWHGEHSEPAMV